VSFDCRPEGDNFYNAIEASIEVPQPITQSGGSGVGAGLAGRRGSTEILDLHLKMPQYKTMVSETNPRSSDPLLGKKFFTDSGEVDPSSVHHYDTVEHDGTTENHESSNGIQMFTSVEINEKVDLSYENSGHHVSEQPV
jgi:hypothetical protein